MAEEAWRAPAPHPSIAGKAAATAASDGDAPTVVLAGRAGGTTHRSVELLATLPDELRLIGGLAVMCRVGTPHRATVDLDAVARNLEQYHEAIARLAVSSDSGGQYRFGDAFDLDVIDVAPTDTDSLIVAVLSFDEQPNDLDLNMVAHTWAHDMATPLDIVAVDEATGDVLARAPGRLVATTVGIVGMKATTIPLRSSSKPEKRASDLYDVGRLLASGRPLHAEIEAMPVLLYETVARRLHEWFVDAAGRDRTFRDVRRFDEPPVDLDDAADAVEDLFPLTPAVELPG